MRILFAAVLLICTFSQASAEKAYLFVHGAWVGEWYWEPVVAQLRSHGHIAQAVTLTGHGRAIARGGPEIALETHIQDVALSIRAMDRRDIILVAHSYGGRPATGAWDIMRKSIAKASRPKPESFRIPFCL